jgi:hypothetical protein
MCSDAARPLAADHVIATGGAWRSRMSIIGLMLLAAMLATLTVLAVGVVGFLRGGPFNERYGNRLMRARVGLQLLAVLLLGLMFLTQH